MRVRRRDDLPPVPQSLHAARALAGIELSAGGSTLAHRCRITGNGTVAVHAHDGAGLTSVEECDVTGNARGA